MPGGEGRFQRSTTDRWFGGVCGGLAVQLGLASRVVRICYAALTVVSVIIPGVIVYLILWATLPLAPPGGTGSGTAAR